MKPLNVNWSDFVKGESSANDVPDKGFSPDSYGLCLTKTRGQLYFADATTDRGGATLTGNIVASAYDKNISGNDVYFADDEGAVYTMNGSTLTKRQTITGDTWPLGTADMLQHKGVTYLTGNNNIEAFTGSDLTGRTDSFWTGLSANYRHSLERVEDKLYVGNANVIGAITDVTTTTAAEITLPTDMNITTLRKHPDGRTLLAFGGVTWDYSHTRPNQGRVYYCDINTKNWTREIDLGVQVEGSKVVGGVIYVTYGQNIGYFDGNGVKFLKRMKTSTATYSQNMTDWEGILLVRDGREVIAFGDLGAGMAWWRPFKNLTNTQAINNIAYKGSNTLMIAFSDGASAGYLQELALNTGGVNGVIVFNPLDFPVESTVRRFEALHAPVTGTYAFSLGVDTEIETPNQVYRSNPDTASGTWGFYRTELDVKGNRLQFDLTPSSGALGFKFFRFFYESIERDRKSVV